MLFSYEVKNEVPGLDSISGLFQPGHKQRRNHGAGPWVGQCSCVEIKPAEDRAHAAGELAGHRVPGEQSDVRTVPDA